MVQKFPEIGRLTYQFTDKREELPEALGKDIQKTLNIDWDQESFIATGWYKTTFIKTWFQFVLVTDKRVVYKDLANLNQNLFQDMTGVEKDEYKNICLLSAGKSTKLFPKNNLRPADKLLTLLFDITNALWIKAKAHNSVAAPQTNNDASA